MKERPILFQGAMVRALLAGTKTQTRRAIKPESGLLVYLQSGYGARWVSDGTKSEHTPGRPHTELVVPHCPYGAHGERLWVREAFRTYSAYDGESMGDMQARLCCSDAEMARIAPIQYEADGHRANWLSPCADPGRYRQARFMPRWASRILLEITEVRVQRLQEISLHDCYEEGIPRPADPLLGSVVTETDNARGAYRRLWEQINGAGSWDANPWVWALSFRRVQP